MATKPAAQKLKVAPHTLLVPEGLYILPTPIILFQKSTQTLWANPAFEKQFGTALMARFQPKENLHLLRERPITVSLFSMLGRHEGFVLDNIRAQKTPVELRVTPYGDASEEMFLVLIEDVTTKQDLEKQLIENHFELQKAFEKLKVTQDALIQSAKLASLGELSSGIAHELNQPLQAIMGFSQELQFVETNISPSGKEFINDIVNASKKMAEIIRSLRSFAREAGEELCAVAVDAAMKDALKLMHHHFMQKGIEVELQVDSTLPFITANSIQLEQVFINLLSNARDAIEQAGRKHGKIKVEIHHHGDCVQVKVRDNGCGMDEITQQKIFDPFFTTKEVGKGTGLGMSISYGILKKLRAEIEVKSKTGEGTEFEVTLPIDLSKLKGVAS